MKATAPFIRLILILFDSILYNILILLSLYYYFSALLRYISNVITFNIIVIIRRTDDKNTDVPIMSISADKSPITTKWLLYISWKHIEIAHVLILIIDRVAQFSLLYFLYLMILIIGSIHSIIPRTKLAGLSNINIIIFLLIKSI